MLNLNHLNQKYIKLCKHFTSIFTLDLIKLVEISFLENSDLTPIYQAPDIYYIK